MKKSEIYYFYIPMCLILSGATCLLGLFGFGLYTTLLAPSWLGAMEESCEQLTDSCHSSNSGSCNVEGYITKDKIYIPQCFFADGSENTELEDKIIGAGARIFMEKEKANHHSLVPLFAFFVAATSLITLCCVIKVIHERSKRRNERPADDPPYTALPQAK